MALSTIWFFTDATPRTGGTMAMPGSFLDPRNPRGPDCGIDEWSPLQGEVQVSAPAGSVFIQDTRSWHSTAPNFSPDPRVAVVVRYSPWWLTCSYGPPSSDGCSAEWAPLSDFSQWPPEMQDLHRHRTCGIRDTIHPVKQAAAAAAREQLVENLRLATLDANDGVSVAVQNPELRYNSEQMHARLADLAAMEGDAPPVVKDLLQTISPTAAEAEAETARAASGATDTAGVDTRYGPELYEYLLRRDGFCVLPAQPHSDTPRAKAGVVTANQAMQAAYAAAKVTNGRWVSRQRIAGASEGVSESPGPAAAGWLHRALDSWLCDPLTRQVCQSLLDPHLRLAHLDAYGPCTFGLGCADDDRFSLPPRAADGSWERSWRASWPHDLADRDASDGGAEAIAHGFDSVPMAVHTVIALESMEIYVVPGSHSDPRDLLGTATEDEVTVCPGAPIPSEVRLSLPPGSTLLLDSRLWWSPRIVQPGAKLPTIAHGCYTPWWFCSDYGGRNQALVSALDYAEMAPPMQLLVRHRAVRTQAIPTTT